MDLASLTTRLAALRDGDEALDRALTEQEARIERWLEAVRGGQSALIEAWREFESLCEASSSAESVEAATVDEVRKDESTITEITKTEVTAEKAATVNEVTAANEPAEITAESPAAETKTRRSREGGLFKRAEAEPAEETAGQSSFGKAGEDSGVTQEDEEALLASLDEQTLAAVRVKRRLYGKQRSLREILDEVRREKPAAKDKPPQRKSWWR